MYDAPYFAEFEFHRTKVLNADFVIVFCVCFLFILKYAVDNIEQEIKFNLEVQYNLIQFVILIW